MFPNKKELLTRPSWQFFFLCFSFIFGIAIHSWIEVQILTPFIIFAALYLFCSATLVSRSIWIGLLPLLVFVGFGVYEIQMINYGAGIEQYIGEDVRIEGFISNNPKGEEYQELVLRDLFVNDISTIHALQLWVPAHSSFSYGDIIAFSCIPSSIEPFDGFRYDRYLAQRNITASCFLYNEPRRIESDNGNRFLTFIYNANNKLESHIRSTFHEPHGALTSGLLIGSKRLPENLEEDFRRTGLSHIIAASGYNVAIVSVVLLIILSYFIKRQQAYALIWFGILAYMFLAGADAAIVRAGVMGLIVLTAKQFGQRISPRNLFVFTVAILLAFFPTWLRDDVGFQLSALATFGLLFIAPRFESRFVFVPKEWGICESLVSSLAAIFATLPIVLIQFGQFSIVAPIANLLILPFIPFIMLASAIALGASLFIPELGWFLSGIPIAFESLVFLVAQSLSDLSFASFAVSKPISVFVSLLWLISIIWVMINMKYEKYAKHS